MNLKEKFQAYCNATNGKASMLFSDYKESGLTSSEFAFFHDNFDYLKYLFICEIGVKRTVGYVACKNLEERIKKGCVDL